MPDLLVVIGVALVAGFVKGIFGMGLPLIIMGLLTIRFGLQDAMVLLIAPSLTTNFWQALSGGQLKYLLVRFKTFFSLMIIAIYLSNSWFSQLDPTFPTLLFASVLCVYAGLNLIHLETPPLQTGEKLISPLVGIANGLMTGVTGTVIFPAIPYFQALRLQRSTFIQLLGILFLISTISLAISIESNFAIEPQLRLLSLAGVFPAVLGMMMGRKIADRLSEKIFKKLFLIGLMANGTYILLGELS